MLTFTLPMDSAKNMDLSYKFTIKVRSNSFEVNGRTYTLGKTGIDYRHCKVCCMRVTETLNHVFVEYSAYELVVDGLTRDFKELLGKDEFREVISSVQMIMGLVSF